MSSDSAARLSRLLALVPWLTQNDGISMTEAAQHFGVSVGQLEKDLWLIVCCGLPGHGPDQLIDIQFWDDDGRINVIDPQTLMRPLRLLPEEATALLVGLRILAQVPGDHDRGALASATEKLEEAAGEAVREGERIVVVDDADASIRAAVEQAVRDRKALSITYLGATSDEITQRDVDPVSVLHRDGRVYLDAWCRRAEAWRTFRMDRILEARIRDESSQPPALDDRDVPMAGERLTVEVRYTPSGRWILDSLGASVVADEPDGEAGGGLAQIAIADPDWLTRLVLGAGGDLSVLAPADLRQTIREAAAAAMTAI